MKDSILLQTDVLDTLKWKERQSFTRSRNLIRAGSISGPCPCGRGSDPTIRAHTVQAAGACLASRSLLGTEWDTDGQGKQVRADTLIGASRIRSKRNRIRRLGRSATLRVPVCLTSQKYKGSVLEERGPRRASTHLFLSLLQQRCVNNWKQPRNTMLSEERGRLK